MTKVKDARASVVGRAADAAVRSGQALVHRSRAASTSEEPNATRVLTVARGADELRALWSDPGRLAHVLAEPYTGDPSVWTVEAVDLDGDQVRFRAHSGQDDGAAPLRATGTVSFAPAPSRLGTEVRLELRLAGSDLAAGATAHKALRRAKALAETGEIPTLAHNPSARHTARHTEGGR